jgi:type I restriction enzyme S subunit
VKTARHTEKLSEIADLNPILAESLESDEPVSFIPMSAVTAETASTSRGENRCYGEVSKGYTPFLDRDLLVAKITPCFENGKIAQATLTHRFGFGSTEFHVIRPKPGMADARYLLHFLRQDHIRRDGECQMIGSGGQRRVPEHFLAGLSVPLPSLPEQRWIAEVLDRTEALRATRRAALAHLDSLSHFIFLDMFGDPSTNPKGWPEERLGAVLSAGPQNGLYKHATDYGTGTPILRIDAFYDGVVTGLRDLKRVRISAQEIDVYGLRPREIIINRVNSREYLGKSALVPPLVEPVVFESNMMRVGVDLARLDPVFLIQHLQTRHVRAHILQSAKDAVNQSSINQQDVKSIPLFLPPLSLQQLFASRVTVVEAATEKQRASLTQLNELFMSLQYRAFQGEF